MAVKTPPVVRTKQREISFRPSRVEEFRVEPNIESDEWLTRVGTALALVRLRLDMSSKALAEKAGVDPDLLQTIEFGDGELNEATLDAIGAACRVVGSTPEQLLDLSLSLSRASYEKQIQLPLKKMAR